jgi:starch-binding outer membrane protein, SusD/RagB family
MKIYRISTVCVVAVLLFSIFSCTEEFLDLKPIAKETEETFYSTFEAVDYTVTAAYSRLNFLNFDVSSVLCGQAACDDVEVGGDNAADGADWKLIDQLVHTPGNNAIPAMWGMCYKGIRLANTALTYLEKFSETHPELVKQRTGEVKFMRAYYHFRLLEMYGGVPIVDKILNPNDFGMPRNSIAEVLHFIQNDLEEAYPDLPLRSELGSSNIGRASEGAARSLLARAYLFESSYAKYHQGDERFEGCEEKFDLALEQAEAVVSSGEYELLGIDGDRYKSWWSALTDPVPADSTVGAFRWIFSVDGDNSREAVFEVQNAQDGRGWAQSTGNGLVIFTTNRYTDLTGNWVGWGFNVPTAYLLNAFRNEDTRETNLSPENMEPIGQYDDPRFGTTAGMEGDLMVVRDDNGAYAATGGLSTSPMRLSNVPTGTACRKYEVHPDEFYLSSQKVANEAGPINWKIIRYADVVLMAAEAAYEEGDAARALTLVNMVRTRARNSNNDPNTANHIYPKNLSAITFDDIIHERRLELALEMSRFQDLVRWNRTDQFIHQTELALTPGVLITFDPAKHFFLPIPAMQIQLSEGQLEQYPGWQ